MQALLKALNIYKDLLAYTFPLEQALPDEACKLFNEHFLRGE